MDQQVELLLRHAAGDPNVIGLAGGLPADAQFPKKQLALSFLRVVGRAGAPALQYGWAEGSDGLRAFIAARLRQRGAQVAPDDILITSGAQQAIAIALELLTKRGAAVAVDAETYPAALELLRCRGLFAIPHLSGATCAYAMPVVSNPRGRALSPAARQALLGSSLPIIEDDAYADLRFAGPAPAPLLQAAPDRVFHVGTFSKVLCPGLRVGWLVVPHPYRRRALELKQGVDLQSSSLSQSIVEDYLVGTSSHTGIDFEARLNRLRRFYQRRALALMRALRRHVPAWSFNIPEGGFALWVDTGAAVPERAFLEAAIAEGVVFDPGSLFRPLAAPGSEDSPLALRLCFSSAPLASFDEGVMRLARAWARFTGVQRQPDRRTPSDAMQQISVAEAATSRQKSPPARPGG